MQPVTNLDAFGVLDNGIEKSLSDTRLYRHLKLENNNLQAILISDPSADKAGRLSSHHL